MRWDTAKSIAGAVLHWFSEAEPMILLNVNVPDIPRAEVRGTRITRLGRRHKAENTITMKNPRGETVYWVGAAGEARDEGEGTDFNAVAQGYVSITPLQIDLTHRDRMGEVGDWLSR